MWLEYFNTIAIILLIFLFCVILVIFAPKSINYFKHINEQIENIAKEEHIMKTTFAQLGITFGDENLDEEYKDYYAVIKPRKLNWREWIDKKSIYGEVQFLPIYIEYTDGEGKINCKINEQNYKIFNVLTKELEYIDTIKSVFFLKIGKNSAIDKHTGWSHSNGSLRFIYCFNMLCFNEDDCGIWVNGECKKLNRDNHYIFDASKEYSIYNNTYDELFCLVIDFERPKKIKRGYSVRNIDLSSFID